MMRNLFRKYKDIIPYAFFGVLTTLINWGVYKLCYGVLKIPNVPSTCLAWVFAVLFAFITNKLWVFRSKSFEKKVVWHEAVRFFSARLATGLLDVAVMWVTVDLLSMNEDIWKLLSNILVILLNYLFSKFMIFQNNR